MTNAPTHRPPRAAPPAGSRLVLPRAVVRVGAMVLAGGVVAVLIWMKLKVVGGVPRTAYADPEQDHPPRQTQSASDDHRQPHGPAHGTPGPAYATPGH